MSYGPLHSLLSLSSLHSDGETLPFPLGMEWNKFILKWSSMGRSKGERNLNIISKLFSSWSQHHNTGWPRGMGGGGRQLVINICFQNEMGASFLCHVLCVWYHHAWIRTRQHKALSVHCWNQNISFWSLGLIFFFFSFLIGVGGRLFCPKREGICTKDLETLWKLMTSSETAFSHTPDLIIDE